MKIYNYPEKQDWPAIIGRQKAGPSGQVKDTVSRILSDIRTGGDIKVLEYVKALDGFDTDMPGLRVSAAEIAGAEKCLTAEFRDAVKVAAGNIRKFHEAQKSGDISVETMPGVTCRQKNIPIGNVGLYIPGGTAPLFSTVLMLAIPASIAGCGRIVLCTPAGPHGKISPAILYAAGICGIKEIYKIGGAVNHIQSRQDIRPRKFVCD